MSTDDEHDPLEDTTIMPAAERRHRTREASIMVFDEMPRDFRDFRDGRREHQLMPHEIDQQDGFKDD
jgi:hypothetical protein